MFDTKDKIHALENEVKCLINCLQTARGRYYNLQRQIDTICQYLNVELKYEPAKLKAVPNLAQYSRSVPFAGSDPEITVTSTYKAI